jgi:hypothetical protein
MVLEAIDQVIKEFELVESIGLLGQENEQV